MRTVRLGRAGENVSPARVAELVRQNLAVIGNQFLLEYSLASGYPYPFLLSNQTSGIPGKTGYPCPTEG